MYDLHKIIKELQKGIPLTPTPYKDIADKLDIKEEELLGIIKTLMDSGVLRRWGVIFDSKTLGYVGTLCAIKTPEDQIEKVKNIINDYHEITHNYLRDCPYNIWFTMTTSSRDRQKEILKEISHKSGITEILDLPSEKVYKINLTLPMEGV